MRLTRKEIDRISLGGTIAELHEGKPVTGLLAEIGHDLARAADKPFDPMRPIIPMQVIFGVRTLTVAGTSSYTVGTEVATAVDYLRPYSVIAAVGGQFVENLQGNFAVPSVTGSATGSWLSSETATRAPSDPAFSATVMAPKTYAGLTTFSRMLRLQAPQTEEVVRRHLARLVGAAVDAAVLNGSGADGEPSGLLTVGGTQSQSGTNLAHAGVLNMVEQATTNGADDRNVVFIGAPTVRETLGGREVVSTSGRFIWDGTIAGKPAFATTSMPAAALVAGDFTSSVVGFWGEGIELMVDPFTGFKSGLVTVRALLSMDVAITHAAAFCKSVSIT